MTKTLTFDKRFDGVRYRDARWKASMRLGTRWIKRGTYEKNTRQTQPGLSVGLLSRKWGKE
jgi:hypothetical protein